MFEEIRSDIAEHTLDHIQETTYRIEHPSELSCAPNRGGTGKQLFLMNHWIERPVPDRVDAVALNDHDTIVQRALTCETERGSRPNLIAVNFANIGHIVQATDTLNDLHDPRSRRDGHRANSLASATGIPDDTCASRRDHPLARSAGRVVSIVEARTLCSCDVMSAAMCRTSLCGRLTRDLKQGRRHECGQDH